MEVLGAARPTRVRPPVHKMMKGGFSVKKRLLPFLLALAMVFSLAVPAFAAAVEEDLSGSVVILHSNDVHGAIDGYATMASLKEYYQELGADVLLVDSGDFSQGEPAVNISQGATAIELMNMAGYDAAAPGNHEFDFGYENFLLLTESADFPIMAANILYNDEVALDTNRTVITTESGLKIGLFGLDTPETATKTNPSKIEGVTFLGGEDLYQCAQEQVDALTAEGCDYIVCLGHLGIDEETAATHNRSVDLLAEVTGIDVFIDAHSHSTLEDISDITNGTGMVGDTYLTSTGTKFANYGVVTISPEGDISTALLTAEDIAAMEVEPNAEIAAYAADIQAEIDTEYGEVFASTEITLNGERDPGNRTQETNLGDLITDAMLWYVLDEVELEVDANHVLAVTNGGGIRATVAAGDITKKDINTVLPYGNTVALVYITGADLLEALEASTYCTPTAVGGFPQVAGMEITINTGVEFDQGDAYPNSTYFAPASINRVTINSVNGQPFSEEDTYAIVTNDFTASGGDTYYAFSVADFILDTGTALDVVVMDYITEELDGVVTEAQYGQPQGRITIVNEPADTLYNDVTTSNWYYEAVEYVTENGIMQGVGGGNFDPKGTTTRGAFMTMLARYAGVDTSGSSPWYQAGMDWAVEEGVSDGSNPYGGVTRVQVVAMMWRFLGAHEYEADLSRFSDVDEIPGWSGAREAIEWAVDAGVMQGSDGQLNPNGIATRAEIAQLMMKFCESIKG